jgi:dihydrofolate reductase
MRKIIVSNLMSLDGFFEGPLHELDWFVFDQAAFQYSAELLNAVDTILFGRVTYQYMAAYWPSAPSDAIADKMNSLPKVVFSSTLQNLEWTNSRLATGNAAEEVSRLKQQPGRDMVVLGSAKLASSMLQAGLVDEYRVLLAPVLIGRGTPLFQGITEILNLKLMATKPLTSGVTVLSYCKA